ncbi:ThiF family adenylyltransferase [Nonomuraea terrae]|uniref:ThiF family adenylyltransferase n=1 Tax=Nonomuraea terrae TaxID=2530383 RepID=UPI0014052E02|nr:ThiF family adenylyltransferase [Nonomuraea terrae]
MRDERTLQYGVHPQRSVMLSGLTRKVREWVEALDGTRDLETVLREAARAGLDEGRARSLLDQLAAQGVLHDASAGPGRLRDLPLAERDRLKPDLDALDISSTAPDGMFALFERRRRARVRVYGAGRVGAQVVALLAASGVGTIRVIDPGTAQARDITPGGLTWAEVGMSREAGAVAVARRLTSGGPPPLMDPRADNAVRDSPGAVGAGEQGSPSRPTAPRTAATETGRTPRSAGTVIARPGVSRAVPPQSGRPDAARRDTHDGVAGTSGALGLPKTGGLPRDRGRAQGAPPADGRAPTRPENARGDGRGDGGRDPSARPDRGREPARGQDVRRGGAVAANSDHAGQAEARGRGEAVEPAVNVLAGGPFLGDKTDRPDLVIIAPVAPLDGLLINDLNSLGIPHLLVTAFEGYGTIGPLVLPGSTACLHCLDLTRRDRDPNWPMVTARLGGYPPGEIACASALAAVVAAAAVGHALGHLDGRESIVTNGTVDVTPDWQWKRRSWSVHPQCRCMRNNQYSLRMVMAPHLD